MHSPSERWLRPAATVGAASLLLVVIGTLEASESARQLTEYVGASRLGAGGAGLTALSFVASSAVYLALGWRSGSDRAAVRLAALTGVVAGLIGGTLRVWLIAQPVRDIVGRYAAVPDWFVPAALAVFVVFAAMASAVVGAAIAFVGVRLRSGSRATRG